MKCNDYKNRLAAYLQGELSDAELRDLENHLSGCSGCTEALKQTRDLLRLMDESQEAEPPNSLREGFLEALERQKEDQDGHSATRLFMWQPYYKVAAAVALLIIGFSTGILLNKPSTDPSELAELKAEVQSMKQLVMISMLRNESASERIKAVSIVEEFNQPSPDVVNTLFNTLNRDENPNVRLAAIRALEKFSYDENIRLQLIRSFEFQSDPVVQITLITLMVEIEEKRAASQFYKLLEDPRTEKIVKDQAQIGIQILA